MQPRRSLIEVPGNVEKMVNKASGFDADCLMLDLEDSVPRLDDAKEDARKNIADFVAKKEYRARELTVRVNPPRSPWFLDDVRWVADLDVDTIVLPKVYTNEEYSYAEMAIDSAGVADDVGIILIVETPGCLLDLDAIAVASKRLDGLMGGGWDYTLECESSAFLRLGKADSKLHQGHLDFLRQKTVAVAAARGLSAMDGLITENIKSSDEARAGATTAKLTGFTGCALIYPPHIEVCNEVFSPSDDEAAWARETVASYEQSVAEGRAARADSGVPILPQHYAIAKKLLALRAQING